MDNIDDCTDYHESLEPDEGKAESDLSDLFTESYSLAILVLQSDRYQKDPDCRRHVDNILRLTIGFLNGEQLVQPLCWLD